MKEYKTEVFRLNRIAGAGMEEKYVEQQAAQMEKTFNEKATSGWTVCQMQRVGLSTEYLLIVYEREKYYREKETVYVNVSKEDPKPDYIKKDSSSKGFGLDPFEI